MMALFRQQPRPFFMIFMLEIWERFGFYTVQGILVLYFVRFAGLSTLKAYEIFGTFSALIYVMVPLGGYLGDKILGTKRTIVVGLMVLLLGYLLLALLQANTMYLALALICVGSALFKSNPGVLLARSYVHHSAQLHAGFTLYYMAINIGAMASLLLGPYISSRYGYGYAYFLSALGIGFGLLNYSLQFKDLAQVNTQADRRKMSVFYWIALWVGIVGLVIIATYLLTHTVIAKTIILSITGVFVLFYVFCMWQSTHKERLRLLLAFVLILEAVIFFTLYQQMPTSINVFAVHHVYPVLMGITLDPQSFQVLNPMWIIVMSPIVAMVYTHLIRKNIFVTVPYKFALGMVFCSIGFMVLCLARFWHDDQGIVSSWWLVFSYLFQSVGEVLVSALGIAMVAELVSPKIMGFVMGMWYLASSMAGFTGAFVASLTALPVGMTPGVDSLMMYTHVFAEIGGVTFLTACGMWVIAPYLTRLMTAK